MTDKRPENSMSLDGRMALVTGGARRIGRSLVLALARQGADIVLHYHQSVADAEDVAKQVQAIGRKCEILQGDLADPQTPERLMSQAVALWSCPVDILINNASVFEQGHLPDTDLAQWNHMQAVNLRAPMLLAQALLRHFSETTKGDIINLNDSKTLRPRADHFAYTLSKIGLHGLTQNLALALAPRIRVNELALGSVLPPDRKPGQPDYVHTPRQDIPLGSFGSVDQIDEALLFLLGPSAGTGQTLYVDGGLHLT